MAHPFLDAVQLEWLDPKERTALSKEFKCMFVSPAHLNSIIVKVNDQVLCQPEDNLHLLELLLSGLRRVTSFAGQELGSEESWKTQLKLLFSMGYIFKDILPGYQIVADVNSDASGKNRTTVKRKKDLHLLSLYERWLFNHFFALIRGETEARWSGTVASFSGDFLAKARLTNHAAEYCAEMVYWIGRSNDAVLTRPVIDALKDAMYHDVNLKLAAGLVPLIEKTISARKKNEKRIAPSTTLALLDVISSLDMEKKERNAKMELERRDLREGIDLSRSRDSTERELDSQIMREVSQSLLCGDFKAFRIHKAAVLSCLITFFVKMIRSPRQYPVDVLLLSFRELAKLVQYVNVELMMEILVELRKLCQAYLAAKTDMTNSGLVVLGAILAAQELMKQASRSKMPIETDGSWIGEMLVLAVQHSLPFITEQNATGFSMQLFDQILTGAVRNRQMFGLLYADFSHMAHCPRAVDLLLTISSSCLYTDRPECLALFRKIAQGLLQQYPSLKEVYDQDGVILSSLCEPCTVAWEVHLAGNAYGNVVNPQIKKARICT